MIRVVLPQHLRTLARVDGEVLLADQESPTAYARRPPAQPRDRTPDDVGESPTTITPERDGPLEFDGHVVVATQRGELVAESDRLVFCRCGRSASKPFCDSSHEGHFETRAPELRTERRGAETPAAFEPNPQVRPGAAAER